MTVCSFPTSEWTPSAVWVAVLMRVLLSAVSTIGSAQRLALLRERLRGALDLRVLRTRVGGRTRRLRSRARQRRLDGADDAAPLVERTDVGVERVGARRRGTGVEPVQRLPQIRGRVDR